VIGLGTTGERRIAAPGLLWETVAPKLAVSFEEQTCLPAIDTRIDDPCIAVLVQL
jgi:hypothetical protein